MTMTAQCLMVNCRNLAPDDEAFCSKHRKADLRHSQARWFAMIVLEAGPSLPSRQKWDGIYQAAAEFIGLLEGDGSMTTSPAASTASSPRAAVEDARAKGAEQ
jgi:hypothetical protein